MSPPFTFAQRARMLFAQATTNVRHHVAQPHFRRYGTTFIMAAAVIGALASKDGHKAQWDHMNSDTSMHVGPWADKNGSAGRREGAGRSVPIEETRRW
jgi:hypothetical protein